MGTTSTDEPNAGGILIRGASNAELATARRKFLDQACKLGIDHLLEATDEVDVPAIRFRLNPAKQLEIAPDYSTLHLCEEFTLHTAGNLADLEKEILLAMLLGPVTFVYPSYAELASSVRIRQNIVEASRHTALSFHVSKIERPTEYWRYSEECGFTVLPGKPLIEALRMATQPELSGQQYSFSCYRATEYVILLGIAQEIATCNPALLRQLQQQWETRAIMSGKFHDVFLLEYGSMQKPLPAKYYVPGDRLWFRNPDERSSDVIGYEGSWVLYMGGGLFTNLWKCHQPYSLSEKCIEIYHWRSGVFQDENGDLQMDEAIVEECVRSTMQDAAELERMLELMMRLRDPSGVYADGGCIDTSREYPRCVHPLTTDIVLPDE
jgi:hypothetical protein